jgi:hypothetical protein
MIITLTATLAFIHASGRGKPGFYRDAAGCRVEGGGWRAEVSSCAPNVLQNTILAWRIVQVWHNF